MSSAITSFADLLRHLRTSAALSQEELATRSGLSLRGISDLERGVRRAPHLTTVRVLADALALGPDGAASAPGRGTAGSSCRKRRTPLLVAMPRSRYPSLRSSVGSESWPRSSPCCGSGDIRLVTLTGAGGSGKTRLALEVGARLQGEFRESVVFVDLAPLSDATLVLSTIASAIGVRERARATLIETLCAILRAEADAAPARQLRAGSRRCRGDRHPACQVSAGLGSHYEPGGAARAGGARVSAHAPAVAGKRIAVPSIEELARVPAVALFVERAAANQPDFALSDRQRRRCLRHLSPPRRLASRHRAGRGMDPRFATRRAA